MTHGTGAGAPPRHSRHRPYVGGEAKVGRGRAADPPRLERERARAEQQGDRGLPGSRRRDPSLSGRQRRRSCARRSGDATGSIPARIVCGAGSDELIALLLRCYAGPGDEVLYSRHGFLMYPIDAMAVGATPIAAPERELTTDVDAVLARVTERTRIVFIANPNNPTGTYLGAPRRWPGCMPGCRPRCLLAIDAAYAEFVNRNDYEPGIALVNRAENVVMLRTFSKIYALAGLRLGWAYCPPAIADVLNRVRGPFNVSAAALAAGVAAVEDVEALNRARAHNERWLPWFSERLAALGLPLTPSVANFVLAALSRRSAQERRRGVRLPAVARHPDPQDGRLRPAATSEDHDRHRTRDGNRRGRARRIHGRAMKLQLRDPISSFPRKAGNPELGRRSSRSHPWAPAFAGVTAVTSARSARGRLERQNCSTAWR